MTEKLYYTDSFLSSCKSKVLNIIRKDNYYLVILDKTVFFPTGGGQPHDNGTINELEITDVSESDGIIYHKLKIINFNVGDNVDCKIDYKLRFSRMQAHTGEHIFSGVAHNLFSVENIGFHMDNNCVMTVDFDKHLNRDQLSVLEKKSNECIYSDFPVHTLICSLDEADKIDYRSKLELADNIRIVEIENVDKCACCAPHLRTTGQVGVIKILSAVSHRGGIRITLICGVSAYSDYIKRHEQIVNISSALCAKHDEVDISVNKLIETNIKLKHKIEQMRIEHLEYIASFIEPNDIILQFFDSLTIDDLRLLSNYLKEKSSFAVILLSGNDDIGYSYCINSDVIDLKLFIKEFNCKLNGSGGGKGSILQGKIKTTQKEIYRFINELKVEDYENAKKETSG